MLGREHAGRQRRAERGLRDHGHERELLWRCLVERLAREQWRGSSGGSSSGSGTANGNGSGNGNGNGSSSGGNNGSSSGSSSSGGAAPSQCPTNGSQQVSGSGDSQSDATEFDTVACGTLSPGQSYWWTFELPASTSKFGIGFTGGIQIELTIDGNTLSVEPGTTLPFRTKTPYYLQITPSGTASESYVLVVSES